MKRLLQVRQVCWLGPLSMQWTPNSNPANQAVGLIWMLKLILFPLLPQNLLSLKLCRMHTDWVMRVTIFLTRMLWWRTNISYSRLSKGRKRPSPNGLGQNHHVANKHPPWVLYASHLWLMRLSLLIRFHLEVAPSLCVATVKYKSDMYRRRWGAD